ncbi:MAG: hypothetical protein ACM3PP_00730 [Candidatus Saccharibacteria bacterium]
MPNSGIQQEFRDELKEHEHRLNELEKMAAEFTVRVEVICRKIDTVTGWIKALVISLLSTTCGFIAWYVEHLLSP